MPRAILLHPQDNVATVVDSDVGPDTPVDLVGKPAGVIAREAIAFGHKVALAALAAGAPVLKYGQPIGHAARDIAAGEHVHTHNLISDRARSAGAGERP